MSSKRPAYGFYTDPQGRVRPITSGLLRRRERLVDALEQALGFKVPQEKRAAASKVLQHLRRKVMGAAAKGKKGKRNWREEDKLRARFAQWIRKNPDTVREALLEARVFSASKEIEVKGTWDLEKLKATLEELRPKLEQKGYKLTVKEGKTRAKGKLKWLLKSEDTIVEHTAWDSKLKVTVAKPEPLKSPQKLIEKRIQVAVEYLGRKRGCLKRVETGEEHSRLSRLYSWLKREHVHSILEVCELLYGVRKRIASLERSDTLHSPLIVRFEDGTGVVLKRSCLLYTSPSPRDRG